MSIITFPSITNYRWLYQVVGMYTDDSVRTLGVHESQVDARNAARGAYARRGYSRSFGEPALYDAHVVNLVGESTWSCEGS
jgi:hypothetical protein